MGRGKKYDIEETEKICLAYVQASNNPSVGSAQKADRFWDTVMQKLANLSPTDRPPGTYRHVRALSQNLCSCLELCPTGIHRA